MFIINISYYIITSLLLSIVNIHLYNIGEYNN